MPLEGSTRVRILPGCPSLDSWSRNAEVGFEARTCRWTGKGLCASLSHSFRGAHSPRHSNHTIWIESDNKNATDIGWQPHLVVSPTRHSEDHTAPSSTNNTQAFSDLSYSSAKSSVGHLSVYATLNWA
ncbi:hypothetical protein T265_11310 [Opisthorchis viverrini]|uniref:Uncharacterized protein n=1 Tax=Opisthorchis viverrini TaxID=6198 RepID=A0A074Z3F1_OPIVI|nr:hypothetical protein T265_11310 [Opisthorchis viverrini]KER20047.1 hypothetical protein T265_11310 [Opisthorchis viverrini]